jgi:hypothetical protein
MRRARNRATREGVRRSDWEISPTAYANRPIWYLTFPENHVAVVEPRQTFNGNVSPIPRRARIEGTTTLLIFAGVKHRRK